MRLGPLVLTLAGALLLVGCSGETDGPRTPDPQEDSATSAPASGSTAAEPTAFAEQPGAEIRAAAQEAMAGVTSLRYRIKVGDGAEAATVDVRASTAGDCTGAASVGAGSVSLLGTAEGQWFKADAEAWRAISAEHADELIEAAGDKWVEDAGYEFANLCFFQNVVESMMGTEGTAAWFVTGTDEVAGQPVVLLQNADSENGTALASVLVDEPHYVVALQRTDDTDGTVGRTTFSEFGEKVEATAPAPDEVVDLSSFLG